MRAYVISTGLLFALVVIAHVARAIEEGARTAGNPFFVLATLAAAGLSVWAFRLSRKPLPR